MIAVIFEAEPAVDHVQDYPDIASDIRPMPGDIDGFVSVERFQSLNDRRKLLSLSFFNNEEAVRQWRVLCQHRKAQSKGRDGVFVDYRLRVADVLRDYGLFDRNQAPHDSRDTHSE